MSLAKAAETSATLAKTAATIRIRTNDYRTNNRTVRRHTASRSRSRRDSTVHRRTSTAGEVQVSMLPDLSEMRSNEETAWEEVMQIKAMPVPMSQKKEMKSKILNEPNLRLQGYEQFKWKRRKMWGHFESRVRESFNKVELWRGALKNIEGNFGTGVVTFFLFLKWLFFLNLNICILILLFITLPTILLDNGKDSNCENSNTTECCAELYYNASLPDNNIFLDLVQGTGILEQTVLFYGFYSNSILPYEAGKVRMPYNIPLAYLTITIFYFLFSLVAILRSSAKGFTERLIEGEGQFYQYCNLVFGGWDFCVDNPKSAKIKHKAIFNEIKETLETEKLEEERQGRTAQERSRIYFIRFVVNTVTLAFLAASGGAIYLMIDISSRKLDEMPVEELEQKRFRQFFYEFLPSITIVGLNLLVPIIFNFLISFEKYSPLIEIRLSLIRRVFLRLASIMVLYGSLLSKILCDAGEEETSCTACRKVPVCWETLVGQQIFKLLITDFGAQIIITFLVNLIRSQLARHLDNKFIKLIGEQTFDLPKHALDIVYIQTLCWFGVFYAPLLSVMTTIMLLLLFYVKKFACLVNSKPSPIIYRASRSNSMFMVVLLISYLVAILPIAYSISELTPSKSCGPFRDKESVWTFVVDLFLLSPNWVQTFIFFLSTAAFAIPVFILLLLLLYYYSAVNSANRHMVLVLKNQLVLEGHDKQFLLDRLSLFIKQENQKRLRAEQMREGDRNT